MAVKEVVYQYLIYVFLKFDNTKLYSTVNLPSNFFNEPS